MPAPIPPPPPLIEAGFTDPVWARWLIALRKRLNDSVTGLVVKVANGFTGSVASTNDGTELTLAVTASGMLKGNAGTLTAATPFTDYMPFLPFAAFYGDAASQIAAANTPTAIAFNGTYTASGLHWDSGNPTRIVCDVDGTFNVQFSIQLANSSIADDTVTIWVRINGVDVPRSAGIITVPPKRGTINGAIVSGWNLFFTLLPGDYFEILWATDRGASSIVTYPASSSPAHPSSPGAIVTFNNIGA